MIKGFKDFILRGNVVDLAVAVAIGAAFTAIVTAFTKGVIQPLIASVGSAQSGLGGLNFQIRHGNAATRVDLNGVVTAALNFVIVAAVIYFLIVVPMNLLLARRRRGEEPAPAAPPEDVVLLQEIRDLLRERPLNPGPGQQGPGYGGPGYGGPGYGGPGYGGPSQRPQI